MLYNVSLNIIIFLFIQTAFCGEVKLPANDFIEGWKKTEPLQTFYKNDLYGHINGGAELFLEFGFDSLLVQDYANVESTLSLEVYCMDSPEAALGIYLMKCGQETPSAEIQARNSTNKFQILAVKNNIYIQLNNFKGHEKSGKAMPVLLNKLLSEIPDTGPLKILTILPEEIKIPGSEKIIRGPYALQPIYTFGEGDMLQLGGKIFGVVANYKSEDNAHYTKIVIPYPSADKARAVFNHLIQDLDPYLTILEKNDMDFIFQDYKKKYGKVKLASEKLFILFHLESKPSF